MASIEHEKNVAETTVLDKNSESEHQHEIQLGKTVDDALRLAAAGENITWTEAEEKKVLRKIDMVILPLLMVGAAVSLADQQAFGYAALFGMVIDLKLYTISFVDGVIVPNLSKYSFASAMTNLGSVAGQFPLLMIAQHTSYGKFISLVAVYTGVLAILTTVCKDDAGILALRFFFGFVSIISPLAIIITAMWWKTKEQPLRVGIYIAGTALGNLIGQAVDIGAVSIVGGEYAGHEWKWIYIILGSVAILYGLIAVAIFPSTPMTAWFLNEREKLIAIRRLADNNTGIQTRKFKLGQMLHGLLDPQLYLLGIYLFSFSFVNSALGSFGAFLVSSFGYSDIDAIKLSMPVSVIATFCMLSSGYLGSKFPQRRCIISICFILPSIVGAAILWKSDRQNVHALLAGLYIAPGFYGAFIQAFALIASNIGGHTKKTTVNAAIVVLSSLGGFAGPWAYHADEAAEGYPTGQISCLALLCASVAAFTALNFYYNGQNKRKIEQREKQAELAADPNLAFMDLTDKENPLFHYST